MLNRCGDQEQLTRLLKQCGWSPVSFGAAADLDESNNAQAVRCSNPIGKLHIDVLPPRRFASGMSSGLWRHAPRRNATRRWGGTIAPSEVVTFHPNFGGFAGGSKKAMLRRIRFESTGGTGWCSEG